jgi:hypothetical protein
VAWQKTTTPIVEVAWQTTTPSISVVVRPMTTLPIFYCGMAKDKAAYCHGGTAGNDTA